MAAPRSRQRSSSAGAMVLGARIASAVCARVQTMSGSAAGRSRQPVAMRERLLAWFTTLKRRTTLTWAEAEFRTDAHKRAHVFLGEW